MRNSKLNKCPKCGGRLKKRAKYRPGIVLDPFAGSGTTCMVAAQLRRDYIGVEIKQEYIDMAEPRLKAVETGVPAAEQRQGQRGLFET